MTKRAFAVPCMATLVLFGTVILLLPRHDGVRGQQAENIVFKQDFEDEVGKWVDLLTKTPAKLTREGKNVKEGKGALEYRYELKRDGFAALASEVPPIGAAKSVRFWLKTTAATAMAFGFQEKDESRYVATFFCPANVWQQVRINFSDLTLAEDTQDENFMFDPGQVVLMGFIDLGNIFAQAGAIENAQRALYLDDFVISDAPVPPRSVMKKTPEGETEMVDGFEAGFLLWAPVRFSENKFGFDPDASLSHATQPLLVREGKQSLEYAYEVKEKVLPALGTSNAGQFLQAQSVRFWVRTTRNTALIFGISERDDSRYQIGFYATADTWQQIRLPLKELELAEDSKDENGKLDLDQVQGVFLSDLSCLLVNFVPKLKGERKLWLDELTFSTQTVPVSTGIVKEGNERLYFADNFEGGLIRWVPVTLRLSPFEINLFADGLLQVMDNEAGQGQGKKCLYVDYTPPEQSIFAVTHFMRPRPELQNAVALRLQLRTKKDIPALVSVEEQDGSRYDHLAQLKSADGWKKLELRAGDFKLADDSKDENNQLDWAQVKQITVADISIFMGGGGANSLWIDGVCFLLAGQ